MCTTTRVRLLSLLLVIVGIFRAPVLAAERLPEDRPNVLLILADDQGFGDLRLHGNPLIDTPTIDRLAREGTTFNHFYVSALCAPTRASILTGRYAARTGVTGVARGQEVMRTEEITLAEMFRPAGYSTAIFGKWHNGENYPFTPNAQGFEEFFGFCSGGVYQYFDAEYQHNQNQDYVRAPGYITDVLTGRAIDFMTQQRARPFFCYVAFNTPHSPWQVADKYFDKYKARGLEDSVATVYGMVENMDDNINRLLAAVDSLGLRDRTIVIFLSDNGPIGPPSRDNAHSWDAGRYNAGMKGVKGGPDEGAMRVPCLVRWPGHVPAGRVIDSIAAHIDVMPTLAELCRVPLPLAKLDGRSLAPFFTAKEVQPAPRTLFERNTVRTDRWRLTLTPNSASLFDIVADPGQRHDVAAEHTDVLTHLKKLYSAWAVDTKIEAAGPEIPVIQVGYPEAPSVFLPVPYAQKTAARTNSPWSQGYLESWDSLAGHLDWPIKVVQAGEFVVRIWYVSAAEALGTRFRVEIGDKGVETTVAKAQDPHPINTGDRVPQTLGNIKRWVPLSLGTMSLQAGPATVRLRPVHLPNGAAHVEIKRVELLRVL